MGKFRQPGPVLLDFLESGRCIIGEGDSNRAPVSQSLRARPTLVNIGISNAHAPVKLVSHNFANVGASST